MSQGDVVGGVRTSHSINDDLLQRVTTSDELNFFSSNDQTLRYVTRKQGNAKPVLNLHDNPQRQSNTNPQKTLFLVNGGIWFTSDPKAQIQKSERYYEWLYAQHSLESNGVINRPRFAMVDDLNEATMISLKSDLRNGKYSNIIIFDVLGTLIEPSTSLLDIKLGSTTLRALLEMAGEGVGQREILVGIFGTQYSSVDLEDVMLSVRTAWRDLPEKVQPNFLFPTSPYNSDTMFGHEFGAIACFLEECLNDGSVCIEAMKNAQVTICDRISEQLDGNRPEICAIQSSTFLYLPKRKLIYQKGVASFDLLEGTTVVGTPMLPLFNDLSERNPGGFDFPACSDTERMFNRIIDKSVNALNRMSKSEPALRREMFCIALTIFDILSGRLEKEVSFTDEQVSDLWKKFEKEHAIPYPELLFRYHSNYHKKAPKDLPKIARTKFWKLFKDTTTFADSSLSATPAYNQVFRYLQVLDRDSDIETEMQVHLKIKLLKKAKNIHEAKSVLGLPEGFEYSPYGLLMLDSDFTRIMNKIHPFFHVTHGTDLELHQMNILGKSPDTRLWVTGSRNVRKMAAVVNKAFSPLINFLEGLPLQSEVPFGNLNTDVGFDQQTRNEPLWIRDAITIHQKEVME